MSARKYKLHRRQSGAVLITSLILLLIMTMLAVTTMRTATMEETMARNAAFANRAFQAAESALASAMYTANDSVISTALSNGTNSVTTSGLNSNLTSNATVTHQVMENAPCPGSSMGIGRGGTFENVYFRVEAEGSLQSGGDTLARSAVDAGISYCIPGS
jgi:type IV pilus assembly protein PilX